MPYGLLMQKESGNNKCPKCCRIGVSFLIVGDGLLGCRECGGVFVRKERRNDVVRPEAVPAVPVSVESSPVSQPGGVGGAEEVTPVGDETNPASTTLVCDICGKECKNALGLNSHKKSHKQ